MEDYVDGEISLLEARDHHEDAAEEDLQTTERGRVTSPGITSGGGTLFAQYPAAYASVRPEMCSYKMAK